MTATTPEQDNGPTSSGTPAAGQRSSLRKRRLGVAFGLVAVFTSGLAVGRSDIISSLSTREPIAEVDELETADRMPETRQVVPTTRPSSTPSSNGSIPSGTTPSGTTPDQPNPARGGFIETFDNNSGLDSFDLGLWHRDTDLVDTLQWSADHDTNCGSPDTQRTIHRDTDEWRYTCRDHMMTAVGDTSGYSLGWFSPKPTFNGQTTISFDVNSTDLKMRQWWEVAVVSASFDSGIDGCELCVSNHSAAFPEPNFDPDEALVFGINLGGGTPMINYQDQTGATQCDGLPLDPEGCASKAIRRTWTMTDNQNGTVTMTFMGNTYTSPGSFPDGDFRVVFKDHNYTPNKDGRPVGYTWHWDNIIVGD